MPYRLLLPQDLQFTPLTPSLLDFPSETIDHSLDEDLGCGLTGTVCNRDGLVTQRINCQNQFVFTLEPQFLYIGLIRVYLTYRLVHDLLCI